MPHFEGVAVDRLDYTELFNLDGDDGVSWIAQNATGITGPAQSLRLSYRSLFERMHELMHDASNPKVRPSPLVVLLWGTGPSPLAWRQVSPCHPCPGLCACVCRNPPHTLLQAMFMNCNTVCRIDLLEFFDGLFSEGSALNAVAWASFFRPSILWCARADTLL